MRPGHVVTIRNLTINGVFQGGIVPGIDFIAARTLVVENCTILHSLLFRRCNGIRFRPSVAAGHLVVTDISFTNNGLGSFGGGIVVQPQAGASARIALERVKVANGVFGIAPTAPPARPAST